MPTASPVLAAIIDAIRKKKPDSGDEPDPSITGTPSNRLPQYVTGRANNPPGQYVTGTSNAPGVPSAPALSAPTGAYGTSVMPDSGDDNQPPPDPSAVNNNDLLKPFSAGTGNGFTAGGVGPDPYVPTSAIGSPQLAPPSSSLPVAPLPGLDPANRAPDDYGVTAPMSSLHTSSLQLPDSTTYQTSPKPNLTYRQQAEQEAGGKDYPKRGVLGVLADIGTGALKGVATGRGAISGATAGGLGLYRQDKREEDINKRAADLAEQDKAKNEALDRQIKEGQLASTTQNRLAGQQNKADNTAIKKQLADQANSFHNGILLHLSDKDHTTNLAESRRLAAQGLEILKDPNLDAATRKQTEDDYHRLTGLNATGYTGVKPNVRLFSDPNGTGQVSKIDLNTGRSSPITGIGTNTPLRVAPRPQPIKGTNTKPTKPQVIAERDLVGNTHHYVVTTNSDGTVNKTEIKNK